MDIVKTRINANLIAPIIELPASFLNKDVEVIVRECKPSIVDELYGIASNISLTPDGIRDERLSRHFAE